MSNRPTYKVPTRNASVLGYGGFRPDGRRAERRRPKSSGKGTPALRAEAAAIPRGTGLNLSDRQIMILCFLSVPERYRRATEVFSSRGLFKQTYQRMTTKPDNFLAMVQMPRLCIPRTVCDKPSGSRNVAQLLLDEAEQARVFPGNVSIYGRDQPASAPYTYNATYTNTATQALASATYNAAPINNATLPTHALAPYTYNAGLTNSGTHALAPAVPAVPTSSEEAESDQEAEFDDKAEYDEDAQFYNTAESLEAEDAKSSQEAEGLVDPSLRLIDPALLGL